MFYYCIYAYSTAFKIIDQVLHEGFSSGSLLPTCHPNFNDNPTKQNAYRSDIYW